jgi:hypothetical protein
MTIDGVWIHWTLKPLVSTLHKSLSHTDQCSHSRTSLLCLVAASNSGRFSAHGLTSLQAGDHLTPTTYSSNCRLKTILSRKSKSSQSVRLGVKPLEAHDQRYFFFFFQLNPCGHSPYVTPSLTDGPRYRASTRTILKTPPSTDLLLLHTCLLRPLHDGY